MPKEPTWPERLNSLTAAVRIAVKDVCRTEQIEAMRSGQPGESEAIERVLLKLLDRFPLDSSSNSQPDK